MAVNINVHSDIFLRNFNFKNNVLCYFKKLLKDLKGRK